MDNEEILESLDSVGEALNDPDGDEVNLNDIWDRLDIITKALSELSDSSIDEDTPQRRLQAS